MAFMTSKKLTSPTKTDRMAATGRKLWMVALALSLSLLCILLPVQVGAVQKNLEFRNLFAILGKQTLDKINTETGPNANLRKFTASSISSTLFRSFYADSSLINTLPEAYLVGVKQAQGAELARFRSIDLVQCYAEHKGGAKAFLSGVRNLGRDLNIILDWDDPKVIKAITKVYGCISKLDAQDITIAASSHYRANDWSGEIRFSWYPTDGIARLYAVITFSGHINVKTQALLPIY